MQTVVVPEQRLDEKALSAVVSATGIIRRFGEGETAVQALRGVSLDIARGQLTAVMGPSGSGKSTLMHILAGLDKPTEGKVAIAGTEITGLNDRQLTRLRREHIGFIFQLSAGARPTFGRHRRSPERGQRGPRDRRLRTRTRDKSGAREARRRRYRARSCPSRQPMGYDRRCRSCARRSGRRPLG
jgi:ABC-type cobalamin/Fe3+-siderophores transport system ATPase subunit